LEAYVEVKIVIGTNTYQNLCKIAEIK